MEPIPEFSKLIDSLDALSNRWEGAFKIHTKSHSNQAAKYAMMLRHMYQRCLENSEFRIDVLGYANELGNGCNDISPVTNLAPAATSNNGEAEIASLNGLTNICRPTKRKRSNAQFQEGESVLEGEQNKNSGGKVRQRKARTGGVELSQPTQEMPTPFSIDPLPMQISTNERPYALINSVEVPVVPEDGNLSDDFTYISQMFLDQQFLDRDRVINYDEGMFATNMDWLGNGG